MTKERERWRRAGALALVCAACAFVLALDTPLCPTATFIGVPCPGCGLTRATFALLHGQLGAAVRYHPLSPVLVPLLFGLVANAGFRYVLGPSAGPSLLARVPARWLNRIALTLFVLVLLVWLLRFFGAFGGPVPVRALNGAPLRGVFAPVER